MDLYPLVERKKLLITAPFITQSAILSELWTTRRGDPDWSGFFSDNELGLPIAHAVSAGTIAVNIHAELLIRAAFDDLIEAVDAEQLAITRDTTLGDILGHTRESGDDGMHGLAREVDALADFWDNYRSHPSVTRTAGPHEETLALAYAWQAGLVEPTPALIEAVVATYRALQPLLARLGLTA